MRTRPNRKVKTRPSARERESRNTRAATRHRRGSSSSRRLRSILKKWPPVPKGTPRAKATSICRCENKNAKKFKSAQIIFKEIADLDSKLDKMLKK